MTEKVAGLPAQVSDVLSSLLQNADQWDRDELIPLATLREASATGMLCPEIPADVGGLGLTAVEAGRLTAQVGALCSSFRSIMTSQTMVAYALKKWGSPEHFDDESKSLVRGRIAAIAITEPGTGSDIGMLTTRCTIEGDVVHLDGHKAWVTGAQFADWVLVAASFGADAAVLVLVPLPMPGVTVSPIENVSGCRAAGHANIAFDNVTLGRDALLPFAGASPGYLLQSVLAVGRLSVAWGCVGITRAALGVTVKHANLQWRKGELLRDKQMIARHIGEMFAAERQATWACEEASRSWAERVNGAPLVALTAKYLASQAASASSNKAAQVLGGQGAEMGSLVDRTVRDSRLMLLIEGTTELCQLQMAETALREFA